FRGARGARTRDGGPGPRGAPGGPPPARPPAARRLLADRLARRGVTLSVAALASACVPSALAASTARAAAAVAVGSSPAAAVSAGVLALTNRMMMGTLMTKIIQSAATVAAFLTAGLFALGLALIASAQAPGGRPADSPEPPKRKDKAFDQFQAGVLDVLKRLDSKTTEAQARHELYQVVDKFGAKLCPEKG